jgi:hypothetical protein
MYNTYQYSYLQWLSTGWLLKIYYIEEEFNLTKYIVIFIKEALVKSQDHQRGRKQILNNYKFIWIEIDNRAQG